MMLNIPRSAFIFSAKNFIASMLALYIALAADLQNPAWSVVTAYIVAQPHAGASLSKANFRVAGTFIGACASIFMVPPLVQTPMLLSLAIALWLGLCVSASLIDRTSRSYFFALAGYTSCIIIFPILTHPQDVFEYGISRFEEISIGIICSAMVHSMILPVSTAPILRSRLESALKDAKAVCVDALTPDPTQRSGKDRQQLAVAINQLHELLLHLGFEGAFNNIQTRAVRAVLAKLERLMPLSLAVTDRMNEIILHGPLAENLDEFLAEARAWFNLDHDKALSVDVDALLSHCDTLKPSLNRPMDWQAALIYNLLERTAELIRERASILVLSQRIERTGAHIDPYAPKAASNVEASLSPVRAVDRDWRGAAGAGLATAVTILIANTLWVGSGWSQGYSAAMMAGVYFAVYAGTPNPSLMLKNKFIGVVLRLMVGFIYMEAILPAVSSFGGLVLVLAPALLTIGVMMVTPRFSAISFNFVVGIFSPTIVDKTFHPGFDLYVNAGIATLSGIYFAMFMVTVTRFLWLDGMVRRTLAAGRSDIANLRYITEASQPIWRSRMSHRIGLLTPRMAAESSKNGEKPDDALRDMMTGGALAHLYAASSKAPAAMREAGLNVVNQVAKHYRKLQHNPSLVPPEALRSQIDDCLALAASGEQVDGAMVLALGSLRRNLFPNDHSAPSTSSVLAS